MNNQEKFTTRPSKLKVHNANLQMIKSYLVRFSTDSLFNSLVSSAFCLLICLFVCLFAFLIINMYSDTHSTMREGQWKKIHPPDFWKQDYFFDTISKSLFNIAIGSCNSAEICERFSMYISSATGKKCGVKSVGSFLDNGLAFFHRITGSTFEKAVIIKISSRSFLRDSTWN